MQGERSGPAPDGLADSAAGSDSEVRRLAGGGLNIAAGLVNQGCLFGVTILLARQLGSSDVGTYAQAFAIRQLLVLVALGGMRSAMTRYVAIHRADDDPAALRGTIRFGLAFTVGTSVVFGVALFAASHWLAFEAFNDPAMESALRWVAVGLPSACFVVATLSATQGFRTQRPFAFVGNMLEPILRLVLTIGVLAAGFGLNGSLIVLQVASIVTAVAAFGVAPQAPGQAPAGDAPLRGPRRHALRLGQLALVGGSAGAGVVRHHHPRPVPGSLRGRRVPGGHPHRPHRRHRQPSPQRLARPPRAADLFRRGQLETLSRLYVASSEWLVRLSLPLLAFLFVCTEPILRLFGPEFVVGVAVTRILIIGTLLDAATTQGGIVLNMSGRNAMNMFDTVGALAINLGLNVLLIPSLGIRGASLAWAVSLLMIGVLRAVQVHHFVVPAYPLSWRVLKSVGAATLAVVVGWPLLQVLPSTWGFLVVGMAMGATYVACLWGLGMEDDDRLVLESVVARVRPAERLRVTPVTQMKAQMKARMKTLRESVREAGRGLSPRYRPGVEPLVIDELISPLRYDVLVRSQFFEFLGANRPLLDASPERFVAAVRATDYHRWYRTVAVHAVGIAAESDEVIEEAFHRRVLRSVALADSVAARGFVPKPPLTIRESERARTATGKRLGPRHYPLDGCHRLALLRALGRRHLEPGEYRVTSGSSDVLDNTARLLPGLEIGEADYETFLASGYLVGWSGAGSTSSAPPSRRAAPTAVTRWRR